MGEVLFYHLTRNPLENTLPMLLERSLGRGWRVLVRGRDRARMEWLDQKLWLGPDDGFLAHGLSGGDHDAQQPILLSDQMLGPEVNGAACLMSIDGAEVVPGECAGVERACILFDGNDPEAVGHARTQWKSLTDAGVRAQYWSEESGRWEMKAQSGGG